MGEKALEAREASLSGDLGCHQTCNLLSKADKATSITEAANWVPHLRKIHIEHHEFCNIACIMCYQLHQKKRRILPNELLLKQIDFKSLDEVQIQGGEPLVHSECRRLIHHLIDDYHIPVTLQTNGLLITPSLADKLVAKGLEIMIAINAATKITHELVNRGSSFDRVLHSISILQEARDRFRSRFRIEGQMTLVRENIHELPDFISFAEQLNLDSISISWEQSIPEYLSANPDLFQQLHSKLREKLKSPLFIKPKHRERLETLFDIGSDTPKVRLESLPNLEPTNFYRQQWISDEPSY